MATTACSNCNQIYPESDIFYCHGCEEYFCVNCGFRNHRDPTKHAVESAMEFVATASAVLLNDVEKFTKDHTEFHSWVLAIEDIENSLNAIKEIKHKYMKAVTSDSLLALKEQLKEQHLTVDQFRCYWNKNDDYNSDLRSTIQDINKVLATLSESISGLQKRVETTTLLVGGLDADDNTIDCVTALQHTSNTSIKCIPMPALTLKTERFQHQSVLIGGSIITMGGLNNNGEELLSSVERVDLRTHVKSDISSMLNARSYFAAGVIGNRLYVCGGWDGDNDMDLCEYYDIGTKKWSEFRNMKTARSEHAAAVLNDVLYTTGGDGNNFTVECYSPITNRWNKCRNLNQERIGHGCAVLEGQIYVCGGDKTIKSCECYDPRDNKWKKCADMNHGRSKFAMVAVSGKLYAIGGKAESNVLGSVEIYDSRNDKWAIVDDVIEPICHMSAVVI